MGMQYRASYFNENLLAIAVREIRTPTSHKELNSQICMS